MLKNQLHYLDKKPKEKDGAPLEPFDNSNKSMRQKLALAETTLLAKLGFFSRSPNSNKDEEQLINNCTSTWAKLTELFTLKKEFVDMKDDHNQRGSLLTFQEHYIMANVTREMLALDMSPFTVLQVFSTKPKLLLCGKMV